MAEAPPESYDHRFKIVLIGDPHVGKTSLLLRYVEDSFSDTEVMNVGVDFRHKVIEVNGKKVFLEIWDTAGQERFRTISSSYYNGAHGIVLVYDVTDEETFSNLRSWLSEIDRHIYATSVQKILIGNKIDGEKPRKVESRLAKDLTDAVEMQFMETSAKEDINVKEMYLMLVNGILASGADEDSNKKSNVITITSSSRKQSDGKKRKCCEKS